MKQERSTELRSDDAGSPRYPAFSDQYINGAWRGGRARRSLADTDPYTSETLTEIALADRQDVEDAYQAASQAQVAWAHALPVQRASVLLQCAALMERRRDEVID